MSQADDFLRRKYRRLLASQWQIPWACVSDDAAPPELLDRIAGIGAVRMAELSLSEAAQYRGPVRIWNGYWKRLLSDALLGLPLSTGFAEASLCIGEVPDAHFNAHVTSYGKKRFLVLMHRGLELLLFRLSILLIATMRVRFTSVRGPDVVIEPSMSMETGRMQFAENLRLVFDGEHMWPQRQTNPIEVNLSTSYTYAMLQFVIAHELGHVNQELRQRAPTTFMSRILKRNHADPAAELDADAFAMGVLHLLIDTMDAKLGVPSEISARATLEAPFIVFRIMEVLERYARERGIVDWDTHPAASERKRALIAHLHTRGVDAGGLAEAETRWQHVCALTE